MVDGEISAADSNTSLYIHTIMVVRTISLFTLKTENNAVLIYNFYLALNFTRVLFPKAMQLSVLHFISTFWCYKQIINYLVCLIYT